MKYFSRRCKRVELHEKHSLWWGAIFATLMMMWFVAAPSSAAASEDRRQTLENNDQYQQQNLSQVTAVIYKKSLQHVFTRGPNFAVNKETLIVGTDGKEVRLKKMLVPCDAVVSYRIENGTPTATRIDIKRVAANANWQWIAEQPE
jgi:hypothetical protein